MSKTTNIVIGALAGLALVVGVVSYNKVPTQIVGSAGQQGIQGEQGPMGVQGPVGERGPVGPAGRDGKDASPVLGSVTGPDVYAPYQALNNSKRYAELKTFSFPQNSGTTTPCAIKSPAASSTLDFASLVITTSTSSATTWWIATSTTAFATSSSFITASLAANLQVSLPWFGNNAATAPVGVVAPNSYVVFAVAGGVAGSGTNGTVIGGKCQARFNEI